ncbi:MAG TPA: anhydro-N-acetylmuramic acid kinase [Dongiaceae bacterium]|nr:anhydro-N-acetylmuramic acid kinase [Dongiaceae bacterium]
MVRATPAATQTADSQRETAESGEIWAIGLMSGTSCDGVDAALIRSDGHRITAFGPALTLPYDDAFRAEIRRCLGGKESIAEVERELTERHAAAVQMLLRSAGRSAQEIGLVGFHGQTILHEPDKRRTWQIGDGALLARRTGIDVINDFRSADVAAGGQGAPLAPILHHALAGDLERPLAVLNLGGVGNVTWIGDGADQVDLIAFDTGPANALIDDWALRHTGKAVDHGGALAQAGQVDRERLAAWLAHPYFSLPVPKSLDRDAFQAFMPEGLSPADGAATLTAFTAATVAEALRWLPQPPKRWLVTGGGRHNPVLMVGLRDYLKASVEPVEAVGWDGDALEAQAFAFMAIRAKAGLPISFPGTTGVKQPLTGGKLHRSTVS